MNNIINDKFVKLKNGEIIKNFDEIIHEEDKIDALTIEGKIQYYMVKISKEVYKFISDICKDLNIVDIMSIRINGDGRIYTIEMCNGLTKTVVGKQYTYDEFLKLIINNQIEYEINMTVRKIYAISTDKVSKSETYWI